MADQASYPSAAVSAGGRVLGLNPSGGTVNFNVHDLANVAAAIGAAVAPVTIAVGAYTVTAGDLGGTLRMTAACVITLPADAPAGAFVVLRQVGAGAVSWAAAAGAVIHAPSGGTATAGQWSSVVAQVDSNADGASALWIIAGMTA